MLNFIEGNALLIEEGSNIALQLAHKRTAHIAIASVSMVHALDKLSKHYELMIVDQRIAVVERQTLMKACTVYPQGSIWGLISNKYCSGLEQVKTRTPRAAAWLLKEGYVSRAILPMEELVTIHNKVKAKFKLSTIAEIEDKLAILCRKDLDCNSIFEKLTTILSR